MIRPTTLRARAMSPLNGCRPSLPQGHKLEPGRVEEESITEVEEKKPIEEHDIVSCN